MSPCCRPSRELLPGWAPSSQPQGPQKPCPRCHKRTCQPEPGFKFLDLGNLNLLLASGCSPWLGPQGCIVWVDFGGSHPVVQPDLAWEAISGCDGGSCNSFFNKRCTQILPQSSPRLCVRHTPHGITSTPVDHEQMQCLGQPGCTSGWLKPNPSSPPVTKPQKVWISRLSQKIMGGAPLNQAQATVRDMGWQYGIRAGFVAKRSNPRQPKGQNHVQRCPRIRPVGRQQLPP